MLDSFGIRPKTEDEKFDVTDVISKVESLNTVVKLPGERFGLRGPTSESVYLVCSNADQADRVRDWTGAGNSYERFLGSVGHLQITPAYILVEQNAPEPVIEQISALLMPFLKRQPFRVFTEYGEVTDTYALNPVRLFDW
ncbi:MAG TPA: hypothetical protein VE262_15290 [Blastocatellia bacterium]|nr:hypothetical protein [Blastocatellia bacterium]